jgi:ABC-2 type transport system permease protein
MTTAKIELRSLTKGLCIWLVIFMLVIFGFSAVYPQMHDSAMKDVMDASLKGLSPALLKTFNLSTSGQTSFLVATGFFAYYFQYMFLAAAIYAMMLGSQALIKEETDGTIEFLYAQPVTRKGIVSGKLLANSGILFLFWLFSFSLSLGATLLFKQSSDTTEEIVSGISRIFGQEAIILFFFLALGFLLSALLRSSKQSMSVSLGIVFGFYLLGILAELNDTFSWAKKLSPIHLGIPSSLLDNGLSVTAIAVLLGCSLLFLAGSYGVYQRKDLKI